MFSARRFYKDLIGRALFCSGAYGKLLNEHGTVLAYHSISDVDSPVTCSPATFRDQCQFLARYFDVVTLSELAARVRKQESLAGAVAISFDDGYKDNAEIAADVLLQYSLPATFFVVTRFIDSERIAWWDEQVGIKSRWMDWDDVREMSQAGFDFGGHTQNHVDLGRVDNDLARQEVNGCRDDLHAALGRDCELFAFPYGGRDNICSPNLAIVKEAGFSSCFSCYGGAVRPTDDVFELHRQPVSDWHVSKYHFGAQIVHDLRAT